MMKKNYFTQIIEIDEIIVEAGFAQSLTFGDGGDPGSNLGNIDYGKI